MKPLCCKTAGVSHPIRLQSTRQLITSGTPAFRFQGCTRQKGTTVVACGNLRSFEWLYI